MQRPILRVKACASMSRFFHFCLSFATPMRKGEGGKSGQKRKNLWLGIGWSIRPAQRLQGPSGMGERIALRPNGKF